MVMAKIARNMRRMECQCPSVWLPYRDVPPRNWSIKWGKRKQEEQRARSCWIECLDRPTTLVRNSSRGARLTSSSIPRLKQTSELSRFAGHFFPVAQRYLTFRNFITIKTRRNLLIAKKTQINWWHQDSVIQTPGSRSFVLHGAQCNRISCCRHYMLSNSGPLSVHWYMTGPPTALW